MGMFLEVLLSLILIVLVAMMMLMQKGFSKMEDSLWKVEGRADKASNKAEAMEMRQMLSAVRGHKLVRHLMQAIEIFDPNADKTYLLRRVADLTACWFEAKGTQFGAISEAPLRYIIRVVYQRHSLNTHLATNEGNRAHA